MSSPSPLPSPFDDLPPARLRTLHAAYHALSGVDAALPPRAVLDALSRAGVPVAGVDVTALLAGAGLAPGAETVDYPTFLLAAQHAGGGAAGGRARLVAALRLFATPGEGQLEGGAFVRIFTRAGADEALRLSQALGESLLAYADPRGLGQVDIEEFVSRILADSSRLRAGGGPPVEGGGKGGGAKGGAKGGTKRGGKKT